MFCSSRYLLYYQFFSFPVSISNSRCQCPGKSAHSSVETLWFWKCQSVGEYKCYATSIWKSSSSLFSPVGSYFFNWGNKNKEKIFSPFSILSGKRGTKCFLHLLKVLPSSRAYIWCYRIYYGYRYLVDRLCNGWTTTWTGGFILKLLLMMSFCLRVLTLSFKLVFQPLFPGDSGVDQLVEIIKVGHQSVYMSFMKLFLPCVIAYL